MFRKDLTVCLVYALAAALCGAARAYPPSTLNGIHSFNHLSTLKIMYFRGFPFHLFYLQSRRYPYNFVISRNNAIYKLPFPQG